MNEKLIAQSVDQILGPFSAPPQINSLTSGSGSQGLSVFLSRIVAFIYVLVPIIFLFMLISSAYQWMTSGGDKEAVAKARARMTYAIIGMFLFGIAFLLTRVLTDVLRLDRIFP